MINFFKLKLFIKAVSILISLALISKMTKTEDFDNKDTPTTEENKEKCATNISRMIENNQMNPDLQMVIKTTKINNSPHINDLVYVVSLQIGLTKGTCSGVSVNENWIISSAHCYSSRVNIYFGQMNGTYSQIISSSRVIRHPHYNSSSLENDIMLIKLSSIRVSNKYILQN
ncbi:unnamed protein product [Oikopleura dioica]|uniref:Peptidase S1 domain-containing protein n=1 Tax=Oikopleura dioica TaxID=34765 RepID=E4YKD6_OIKDI|nr:unnamed protein product [Oikopleura dioica]